MFSQNDWYQSANNQHMEKNDLLIPTQKKSSKVHVSYRIVETVCLSNLSVCLFACACHLESDLQTAQTLWKSGMAQNGQESHSYFKSLGPANLDFKTGACAGTHAGAFGLPCERKHAQSSEWLLSTESSSLALGAHPILLSSPCHLWVRNGRSDTCVLLVPSAEMLQKAMRCPEQVTRQTHSKAQQHAAKQLRYIIAHVMNTRCHRCNLCLATALSTHRNWGV